jgi:hypothetical protein
MCHIYTPAQNLCCHQLDCNRETVIEGTASSVDGMRYVHRYGCLQPHTLCILRPTVAKDSTQQTYSANQWELRGGLAIPWLRDWEREVIFEKSGGLQYLQSVRDLEDGRPRLYVSTSCTLRRRLQTITSWPNRRILVICREQQSQRECSAVLDKRANKYTRYGFFFFRGSILEWCCKMAATYCSA